MKKAIIWCRVSTTEQEFESQKTALIKTAISDGFTQDQLIVIGAAGASAIKMNELYQKEVNELLSTIESDPEVSTIYVWETSRLARNEVAFYQMKDRIIKNHIQLVCNVPQLRLLDDNGTVNTGAEITLNLLVTLAKQEMDIKKSRFSRGKERLAIQGRYNGGAIPFGYRIDRSQNNLIVIDEDVEAPIVREIFRLYEQGLSQMAIAKEMFNRGIKGRAARGTKAFTISLVHQILTNELLTGAPHLNKGSSYTRQYPQIITTEQFQRCRQIALKNNKCLPKSKFVFYAHGLIKCTECGRNFVSTGNKGYYRCRDAYNYNKKYDGYDGIPMCSNKVCISVNIMDSLLWELAKGHECIFILNSASKKLKECEAAAAILRQKIEAVPALLADVDKKRARLYDVYVRYRMREAQFKNMVATLYKEEREIRQNEAEYREQLVSYETLIKELNGRLNARYDSSSLDNANALVDDYLMTRERLDEVTDDGERYKIIHKHIERVTIESTTIKYKFANHPEEIDAFAKKIVVHSFLELPRTFYFVPYNGKGGVMLEENAHPDETINLLNGQTFTYPQYKVFKMSYLPRLYDKSKMARREKLRIEKEKERTNILADLKKKHYIPMDEMRTLSGLSYSTIYNAIHDGKLKAKNVLKTWFAKENDFKEYLEVYKPKPRTGSKMDDENHAGYQRLLKAILYPDNN